MRRIAVVAAIALAVMFVAGLYWLLHLRFESGDVYPPYSTFRADPLGAEALYESMALEPGIRVSRNVQPLENVHGRDATVFFLGLNDGWLLDALEGAMAKDLERIAREGGRIVVAFVPERPALKRPQPPPVHVKHSEKDEKPALLERLGVKVERQATTNAEETGNGPPRYTALWFDKLAPEWTVVRRYEGRPVLIERPWNGGSIVLIADSWMLSNEALAAEPDAPMLVRIAGPNHTLVFDELHLGIERTGSIAGLLRKYRLQGVVAVLLALALLFIWKNASPLLPRRAPREDEGAALRGHSTRAGLVNLLERSVPPARLMETCVQEYRTTPARNRDREEAALRECERSSDPVAAYERARRTLGEIRHPWKQTSSS